MKTIFILSWMILCVMQGQEHDFGKNASCFCNKVSEEKDRVKMPDRNDWFIILTSDTVADGKEGIFRSERVCDLPLNANPGYSSFEICYELRSEERNISEHYFTYRKSEAKEAPEHLQMRKLVLPKRFLENVNLIDLDAKFLQFKDVNEVRAFFLDLLMFEEGSRLIDMLIKRSKRKPVWLIDRRYETKDTVLLLEVSPGFVLDRFGVQKDTSAR